MPISLSKPYLIHFFLLIIGTGLALFSYASTPISNSEVSFYPQANFVPDSTLAAPDSTNADSTQVAADTNKSKEFLSSEIKYKSVDSLRFDVIKQTIYLYGGAQVEYEDTKLNADYIEFNMAKNEVYATGLPDSTGKMKGNPEFEDKGQGFKAETMRYNFKSKKAQVTTALTQKDDGYVHGDSLKMVNNDVIYIKHGKYTTCSNPEPHFHIESSKLKLIKNNKIVTGPAILKIENVPTPLAIPFGFFPNKKGKSSGILMPTYGNSPGLGYFLNNGGYYFAVNDYMDLSLTGDIYSRGSWGGRAASSYYKRYGYRGNVNVEYTNIKRSDPEFPDFSQTQSFFVRWSHTQDPKARPNSRFSANVNAGSTENFRNNFNSSANDFLSNEFKSNISYNKSWPGRPYNLTLNASHSQNTRDSIVNVTLPSLTFTRTRQNLGDIFNTTNTSSKKWYNKVGVSMTTTAENRVRRRSDVFFKEQTLDDMNNGVRTTVPVNASLKLANKSFLKNFTLTPGMNYTEVWQFETIRKSFSDTANALVVDTVPGFRRYWQANANAGLTTKIYSYYTPTIGPVKKIRHVMTPSVNINYTPDYSSSQFNFYRSFDYERINFTSDSLEGKDRIEDLNETYSIFDQGIYGAPSRSEAGVVGFGLINNLEMKVKSDKDSTGFKKVKLFEAFTFNSSYSIPADSLNWAPITMRARTVFSKNINMNLTGRLDPYALNPETGVKFNQSEWKTNRRIGRLTNATAAVNFTFRSKKANDKPKTSDLGTEAELATINNNPEAYVDFNVPWSLIINYNLTYSKTTNADPTLTNTIGFNGDVNLTPKWKLGFRSGYDFEQHDFSYTTLDIYRDLHCWEFRFSMVPFGDRQSYTFDINVKAPVLQDLKLSRKRQWFDFQ